MLPGLSPRPLEGFDPTFSEVVGRPVPEKGTRAQIALRYGFSNESLSCIVTGLSKIEHLDQIIEAESFGPLDQDLIEKINFLHKSNFS